MKIFLFSLIVLFSHFSFAKKYGCNIQKIPQGKEITLKETKDYIKQFDFKLPIRKSKTFNFKNISVSLHKSEDGLIPVSFKDTEKNYQVHTSFYRMQNIFQINTDGDETFICWSEIAQKNAKEESGKNCASGKLLINGKCATQGDPIKLDEEEDTVFERL